MTNSNGKILYVLGLILMGAVWAAPASSNQVVFDDYVVFYNAFSAEFLPPEMATAYGLTRSKYLGVVNISVHEAQADGTTKPIIALVNGQAVNNAGQLKNLRLRQVKERDAIYYIDQFRISHTEDLKFTIWIQVSDRNAPIELKFRQEFFTR